MTVANSITSGRGMFIIFQYDCLPSFPVQAFFFIILKKKELCEPNDVRTILQTILSESGSALARMQTCI